MKFEILTKKYQFHINFTLESAKKSLGIDLYQGYKILQKSHIWPFFCDFDILPYLQLLNGHNLGSTNDRRLVLVSNIKFWNELSEKIYEIFFWAQKSHFFAKRGPFWVPVTPSTRKFEILTLPYHFHIKFMLESTRETLGIDLYEGALHF